MHVVPLLQYPFWKNLQGTNNPSGGLLLATILTSVRDGGWPDARQLPACENGQLEPFVQRFWRKNMQGFGAIVDEVSSSEEMLQN